MARRARARRSVVHVHRILAALFVVTLTFAAVTATVSSASPASAQSVAQTAQQSDDGGRSSSSAPAEGPSIVPKPTDDGTTNVGGLIVGTLLIGGWLALGAVLFLRGRRRRQLQQA